MAKRRKNADPDDLNAFHDTMGEIWFTIWFAVVLVLLAALAGLLLGQS